MKISIIIPVYNAENYLEICLQSIYLQTYKDFEVVCIDDGSTDSSIHILKKFADMYDNFRYKSIQNSGVSKARNLGFELSRGEFICFLDSDDTFEEKMIEKLINIQEKDQCDLVVCGIDRIFDEGCNLFERFFKYDMKLKERHNVSVYNYPEIITLINNSPFSKLIRREALTLYKIRFPEGIIYEDMVFTHKLLATGISISIVEDKLYKYLIHKESIMTSNKSKVTDIFVAYEMIYNFYKNLKIDKEFKSELDYLLLYHIGIGTAYRLFRSKQYGFKQSICLCKNFMKKISYDKKNQYIKNKSCIERLFIAVFY